MIIEQRTYDIVAGQVDQYVALYQAEGLAIQLRHLKGLLGYYTSEAGVLNRVIHLWSYEDTDDRATRRASLFADPTWLTYFDKVIPLVIRQKSIFLRPLTSVQPMPARIHDTPATGNS